MDYKFLLLNWFLRIFYILKNKKFKENLLLTHKDVLEAAVFAIPDEINGEVPKACVVLHKNVSDLEQDVKLNEIYEYVNCKIFKKIKILFKCFFLAQLSAPYKHLRGGISAVSNLPKTASGKVLKSHLKNNSKKREFCNTIY